MANLFMTGDLVRYVGGRAKVSGKLGEVVCHLNQDEDKYVVSYGDDAYIFDSSDLERPSNDQVDRYNKEYKSRKWDNE